MIVFKSWMPDQPPLGLDGLTEAENVLPTDEGSYSSFPTMESGSTATLPSSATINSAAFMQANGGTIIYVVLDDGDILSNSLGGATWTTVGAITLTAIADTKFLQYEDTCIVTNQYTHPQRDNPVGNNSFSTITGAPRAGCIGQVGQFVMLGEIRDASNVYHPAAVQWSGIGDPTSWPTPSSSTAIASQSGFQDLGLPGGKVTDILGGDQFGVILQLSRVTRCTYIGGTAVFQFDEIDNKNGSVFPYGAVRVNDVCYFISYSGFKRTNGVVVESIGAGIVDNYFWQNVDYTRGNRVRCAYDYERNLIFWVYPSLSSAGVPSNILIYNIATGRWSRATTNGTYAITADVSFRTAEFSASPPVYAFNSANKLQGFSGTPGTATLTTGETEGNEGGYSFLSGVKPVVDATAGAITVAVGTRSDQDEAVTYTSEVSPTTRTKFCDFRSEARYHRARLKVTGAFDAAQGIEIQAQPSSDA